jgi:uncharacterized membrane protein
MIIFKISKKWPFLSFTGSPKALASTTYKNEVSLAKFVRTLYKKKLSMIRFKISKKKWPFLSFVGSPKALVSTTYKNEVSPARCLHQ